MVRGRDNREVVMALREIADGAVKGRSGLPADADEHGDVIVDTKIG
jgi:hypothetical protein